MPGFFMGEFMKLPPYARQIRAERDRGYHPPRIWVLFGDDWGRRPDSAVCVRPGEYQPGEYDWSFCAGVPVSVVERTYVSQPARNAMRLAAEIAATTAPVAFHWIAGEDDWPHTNRAQEDIGDLMWCVMPRSKWWNKKTEQTYQQRSDLYYAAMRKGVKA